MRSIMSVLVVSIVGLALVSVSEAKLFTPPYPCIASPAYTDYIDAKNGPCPGAVSDKARKAPAPRSPVKAGDRDADRLDSLGE